jgi:hypothetical protein
MPDRQQWLIDGFYLCDHPFEPVIDPVTRVDLRARRVNLTRPLDVFGVSELEDYFAKVGSFADAVRRVSAFLAGQGFAIDQGTPPVILIEGPGGSGRKSLGNYVAHLMKAHCADPPGFKLLPVNTDHFGKLLLEIRFTLERHLKPHGLDADVFKSRDAYIKPEDPDETVLAGLFSDVAQQGLAAPMLILLVDSIDFKHFDWITKLQDMLAGLNVAFIFLTRDSLVTRRFNAALSRNEYAGQSVQIGPLTMEDGRQLLSQRIGRFRVGAAPQGIAQLTPYEEAAVEWMFTNGQESRAIKMVLNLCRVAMNLKLVENVNAKLAIPPQPGSGPASISKNDLELAYKSSLQQASWGGQR